jgi:hypothetical protein
LFNHSRVILALGFVVLVSTNCADAKPQAESALPSSFNDRLVAMVYDDGTRLAILKDSPDSPELDRHLYEVDSEGLMVDRTSELLIGHSHDGCTYSSPQGLASVGKAVVAIVEYCAVPDGSGYNIFSTYNTATKASAFVGRFRQTVGLISAAVTVNPAVGLITWGADCGRLLTADTLDRRPEIPLNTDDPCRVGTSASGIAQDRVDGRIYAFMYLEPGPSPRDRGTYQLAEAAVDGAGQVRLVAVQKGPRVVNPGLLTTVIQDHFVWRDAKGLRAFDLRTGAVTTVDTGQCDKWFQWSDSQLLCVSGLHGGRARWIAFKE